MLQTRSAPPKSRLSRKFLAVVLGVMLAIFSFVYIYSVPLIKQTVFDIERHASQVALNNVFEIANQMYSGVEDYRAQALESHQRQLETAVSLAEAFLRSHFREALKNGISMEDARRSAFSYLRDFNYGNNDYIFVADYNAVLLSHPDPRYHGKLSEELIDENGDLVVANLVKLAVEKGQGTYRYRWNRLSGEESLDKVSFVRNYPEWGFVIGSGVYLDDIEAEVKQRKQAALLNLRTALQGIKIAKTGYMYVFDSNKQMLIHPNQNLDGVHFADLLDPVTKRPISDELIKLADTGRELEYRWDRPDDPGHYVYEKLSLVRYMPGFDWYICSSVYLGELQVSANVLSNRLMIIAGTAMLIALLIAAGFIRRLTQPLEQLAETAIRVHSGDLSAKSEIKRDDEVGILASSFDAMVDRLKNNIQSLDQQVKQRTEELVETNAQAQRMSAVGQLSGGLAHDFNNLLTIIIGNLLLAKEKSAGDEQMNERLDPALRASRRSAEITQRLLAFSRRQPLQPVPVEADEVVSETTKLLRGTLGPDLTLVFTAGSEHSVIEVDPAHLENALVNLALNARDAMPGGGEIRLTTDIVQLHGPNGYDEDVTAGDYVRIRIADQGNGFSSDAARHAFEPFFTTKKGSRNSGLGLSMVYGFVKQSAGYVGIDSPEGGGATVSILLPLSTAHVDHATHSDVVSEPFADKLFLLAEDNNDVRQIVRDHMTALGMHVIEAHDGEEALQLLDTLDHLDGLLSDVAMPGPVDGHQLANAMKQRHPDSIILLMSGYTSENTPTEPSGYAPPLLRKPFDRVELARALGRASGQRGKRHE